MSTPERTPDVERGVFDRILVEIDETRESLVAAAQARCLAAPGAELELLGIVERAPASHAGVAAVFAADTSEAATAAVLERAKSLVEPTSLRFVAGRARDAVLDEARRVDATLVAVGMHAHGRLTARLFGTLDAAVLRDAPCSVLVARPGWGPTAPKKIVVGVDGSPSSRLAERVARSLAERLGAELQVVIAVGGKPLEDAVFAAETLLDPRDPPEALASAAGECDLLVIGNRGAHGAVGLGRVGERVVYSARSSVLVVRAPAV